MATPTSSFGLSNSKSICIILVVIGCFSVLWPRIFYPMLMYGLSYRNSIAGLGSNVVHDDQMLLPPKVREAMRLAPMKTPSKLPGRPQFYTGKREIAMSGAIMAETPTGNSIWNLLVPLYALILVVIFLLALFKLSFRPSPIRPEPESRQRPSDLHADGDGCKECQYDRLRREYTYRRYDPFLSRSTYRVFDFYGRRNVQHIMRSLVDDVQRFREHLIKAKQQEQRCPAKESEEENQTEETPKPSEPDEQISTAEITESPIQEETVSQPDQNQPENIVEVEQDSTAATVSESPTRNENDLTKEEKENQPNEILTKDGNHRKRHRYLRFRASTKIFKDRTNNANASAGSNNKIIRTINHRWEKIKKLHKKSF